MTDDNLNYTPPELREMAEKATEGLIPTKSNKAYKKQFDVFSTWCEHNNVKLISENVLMAYFQTISEKKSSTLWTTYSILRTMINIRHNIDISKYLRLQAQLKRHSEKYEPKKSKILEAVQIERFIVEAPNETHLVTKVALIMGYCGACRREELTNMLTTDIEYKPDSILISVPKTKTNTPRLFAITESRWINLIKHYASMRPECTNHERFFVNYRNGRCTKQPIGINKMGHMPKAIATYLKLPNPELYSGHCFRRSSASHLANTGGDLITIKRHGGWKSSAVAEGYIEASLKKKIEVAQMLAPGDSRAVPSTSALPSISALPSTSRVPSTLAVPSTSATLTSTAALPCDSIVPSTSDGFENATVFIEPQVSVTNVATTTTASNSSTNVRVYEIPNININSGSNCNITVNIYNQTSKN